MRRVCSLVLTLSALTAAGCSGFSIGVRQDTEDRDAVARVLDAAPVGGRLRAGELLAKDWTRLWVLRGGGTTKAIENRIEIPFPESGEAVPAGSAYFVFADDEAVVSAFSSSGPSAVGPACLTREPRPLRPDTELVVLASAGGEARRTGARLATVAGASRCR